MRRRIVAGNWKMNTTYTEAMALVDALKESLTEEVVGETGVIITPPALYLSDAVESLVDNPFIAVAAQNCHEKESGAYTGEWSAPMLASLDIDAIIIGHSERREYFGETNEACNVKISQALNNELAAIYCIGETLEERKSGAYMDVILKQCEEGLAGFIGDDMALATCPPPAASVASEYVEHIRGTPRQFPRSALRQRRRGLRPAEIKNVVE